MKFLDFYKIKFIFYMISRVYFDFIFILNYELGKDFFFNELKNKFSLKKKKKKIIFLLK